MNEITRGTTPGVRIALPEGMSADDVAELWLTIRQCKVCNIEKKLVDMETVEGGYAVHLTQAETLQLSAVRGMVEVQARLRTVAGDALASVVYSVSAGRILKDGEI